MERNHICKKCGGIAGWDSYYQSWICTRCGDFERKPVTNYDRIISKTPEELAEWLSCNCTGDGYGNSAEDWLDWLRRETEL